jgi:alpha-tubulin suppressor-like RCC1 family protein
VTASGFAGVSSAVPPAPRLQGGVAHTCALTEAGAAWCWGWNGNGQLGDGSVTDRSAPVAVRGGLTFDLIGAGGSYSCGMRGNGVWCWGSNVVGQLGNGTTVPEPAPVKVGAPFDRP